MAEPNQICEQPATATTTAAGGARTDLWPDKFCFEKDRWLLWKKRFSRYMSITGNDKKSDSEKVNILVYCMGEKAEDLLTQFASLDKYEEVLQQFDNLFTPKKNIIFERYKFNILEQNSDEGVEEFITKLFNLAENCEYGTLKEQLIRDRIVVGMKDRKTSERLQLKEDLTLEQATLIARQAEIQQKESKLMKAPVLETTAINKIKEKKNNNCWFCGNARHPKENCPAFRVRCHKCQRVGHFAKMCRPGRGSKFSFKKDINSADMNHEMEVQENGEEKVLQVGHESYERTVAVYTGQDQFIDNIVFLVDTGADVVAVPDQALINRKETIVPCKDKVVGPDGKQLQIVGVVTLKLIYKDNYFKGKVYVIKNLKQPILGRPAIQALNIVKLMSMANEKSITCEPPKSQVDVMKEFPNIFNELGVFKDKFSICLVPNPRFFVQATPRVVPIPLLSKLKNELARLVQLGIVSPVEEPTQFVSPIVVVPKGDKIRLCGDYTQVNKNILRPIFPIPKVEVTLAQLKGSKYFSKIDATSGFHQIPLDEHSKKLTTIITPFGRYMYNRLPFGLSCAPEYFSMKFSRLFEGLEGVVVHMDDILIFAESMQKHDWILREVLERLYKEGITINEAKCVFGVEEVKYLGHIIDKRGISLDPDRVKAIQSFKSPQNKKELMQFLGIVNYVGRFIANKSDILQPLHALLKNNSLFVWDKIQEESFENLKKSLKNAPVLTHFDPSKKIIITADSNSYGLGAALLLEDSEGHKKVVAYASRSLSNTEKQYAQIEKEFLALAWSVDKFKDFVIGVKVHLETDHKQLLQILKSKPLDDLTPRLLRFRLKLMRFDYDVDYVPGKDLLLADALSRQPLKEYEVSNDNVLSLSIINEYMSNQTLSEIALAQQESEVCKILKEYTAKGWPRKNKILDMLKPYYQFRYNFTFAEGFLLYNSRLVVPHRLQGKILNKIHEGHQGITKCRERARTAVWWLNISKEIESMVTNCSTCIKERINCKEPLIVEAIPDRPWQKIGMDLFKLNNMWYLVMIDYYSRFIEIFKLSNLTEHAVITCCKETFSRYGIPDIVRSDCGSQFKSKFNEFSVEYGFKLITSSPYFPQSNGMSEAGVKIAKSLLKKNEDIFLGLLTYRNTPLESGYSPAELMFHRKLKDTLPILPSKLKKVVNPGINFKNQSRIRKAKMATNFNNRHRTRSLGELKVGERVWITDLRIYGIVESCADEPRSYIVRTERGKFRRNRFHLIVAPYGISDKQKEKCEKEIDDGNENYEYEIDWESKYKDKTNIELDTPTEIGYNDNVSDENVAGPSDLRQDEPVPHYFSGRPTRLHKSPSWLTDYVT